MSRDNKISISLIAVSVAINLVNHIFFYGCGGYNPFYSFFSFLAFIAGMLGITVFPAGIAAIIAVFFIIPKSHEHRYLYYFALLFYS